jgi:predicted nucleotidyltransferase
MHAQSKRVAERLTRTFQASSIRGLVSAYLFGSHPEGRAHRESDVDVGVLLAYDAHPTRRERFEVRVRLCSELPSALGEKSVDVVVLNDAPPLLGRRIVTTGQRVFCTDAEADHVFVRDVQLRAADLEPFLKRMSKLKLEALAR